MVLRLIILILLSITIAKTNPERMKVNFNFNFDPTLNDMTATCSGADAKLISDIETKTFKLNIDNLKYGGKQILGDRSDEAYLRSPKVWSDLYKSHNWTEVVRILKPIDAKIVKVSAEPKMMVEQIFENRGTASTMYNLDISHIVENTFTSHWMKPSELTVDRDILHEFDIGLLHSGGVMTTSFTSSWGINSEKKQKINIGSASEFHVKLQPNDTVVAQCLALKAHAQLQVDFIAVLDGHVVFAYDAEHNGHRFWGVDVQQVMKKGGLETSVKSKEVMEVVLHTHPKITIDNMVHSSEHTELFYK